MSANLRSTLAILASAHYKFFEYQDKLSTLREQERYFQKSFKQQHSDS